VADAKQITEAVSGSAAATQGATAASDALKVAVANAGLSIRQTWDANTAVLDGATAKQVADLEGLGYTVTHLPNGQVEVTADTGPARAQMDQLARDYANKQIAIAGGNAGPAAYRVPGAGTGGLAAGGPVHGPGTGTSDTAGLFALSNGEHVWTAAETQAAGGHSAVEALRKAVLAQGHGRAAGGAVGLPADMRNQMPAALSQLAMQQAEAIIAAMVPTFTGGGVSGGNAANRALGQQIAASMGLAGQFAAIDYVFSHESGWNNLAQNPTSTAYGIAQFLDSTWATVGGHKTSDPALQIEYGLKYMNKYGGPNGAASFWQGHHWYDGGGYLMPGVTMAYNGTGKPERIRTAEQEAALGGPTHVTLQLDRGAVTDLLDGRIVTAFSTATNRAKNNTR
jgi:hypothetical protein